MNVGDEYVVNIEKLTNLGLGLAKIDGFVVFVENACPQDELKIKITKITKNYGYAKIIEIMEPSPQRVDAFCPMQKVCGSCQIQFINYDYQLEFKRQIVADAMKKIGGLDINIPKPIPSPEIKNYRHKIQYPISETKNSKRILAGYYKSGSHEIVNIKYCPIQPEICDKIIEFIREKSFDFGICGFIESKHCGDLRHVVIRHSASNGKSLVVLVINATKIFDRLKDFANAIYEEFEDVIGVCVNFNSKKTNVIMGSKTECIVGIDHIEENILGKTFIIGAETFFQVNPKSAENIFNYVKEYIAEKFDKPLVLDAYAGISAFGICVSDVAGKVVTIEENLQSVELAKKSVELNNIKNVEIHGGDAGEFFAKEKRKFDVIILDPPRKGCTPQSLDKACELLRHSEVLTEEYNIQNYNAGIIIYVSCNPATLARDLKYLKQKGCIVESIQPFDMFCHTYHIENVAIIKA